MNRNLQRVLVGLVSFSILAAPFVSGAALANICGAQDGHWRIARVPAFKQGSGTFVDYEVDRSSPNRIMVTNGTVVMLSTDSACSWKQVFALPDQANSESGSTAANSLIKTIDISEIKRDRVLLMVEEQTPLGVRPHVVRSDDMGGTWASGDVGLPPQGAPEELVLPPSSPDLAYLAIDIGGGSIDLLFASTDGGLTWVARSNPTAITQQMAITDFTVDPLDAQSLWAWGTNGLYHSTDGGATYNAVQDFIGRQVTTTDVYHGDGDARIAGFLAENQVIFSTNGGQTWLSQASPPSANSSAHGDGPADAFITAGGEPYAYNNVVKGWTNLGAPRDNLSDATTDKADVVYFRTAHEILSYSGPPPAPGTSPDDVFQGGYIDPPRQVQEHDPILTPARRRIALDPGETKTVKYDLALSKTPLPVNVFFLLDTSDSMGATIDDLAASVIDIYNLLNEQNFKLKIGVGAFRAFPDHFPPRPNCDGQSVPGQTCETNYVFKNFYDIAPASATVRDVLDNLESDAGGFYKSHLQALYTLATGERVDLFPAGPDDGDVPAGEGATFDDEAYRVVIHATDEAFWKGEARDGGSTDFGNPTPPETPLFDDVDEALGAKEIYQVGLSIGPAPRHDLERVAELTDALAPAGGVDCGKNHFLAEGDPLVCPVSRNNLTYSTNLVPAIVNLIENLPTGVNVDYQVKGDERIVKKVTPENKSDVVLQVANDLDFEVTYHCPADLSGKSFDIKLNALNEGEPGSAEAAQLLADGTTEIVCRETPKDNPVIPPIVAVSLVSLAIPPPPPPPPAQLTSASQAQSQAQAQTGAVFEEEKEPQLAIAAAYREAMQEENDYAYEMVAYEGRKEPVSPYLTLGAGAVMTAMAAAGMMIHRTRQSRRLALQYNRRSRR